MQKKTFEGKTALILLSGGQDSTTCLFWAKEHFSDVRAIGFDYGQKHKVELDQAKEICWIAGEVPFDVIKLPEVLGGSSLTDHAKDHNAGHSQNSALPASFTAGRNALFLTIAGAMAYNLGISDLVTGTCQTDFSGYPDCRRQFIDAQQVALTLALDRDTRIHTPLMYLTKAETWRLAKDLNIVDIIVDCTMTDYNGSKVKNEWGFGIEDNPATKLRAAGFREAKEKGWI